MALHAEGDSAIPNVRWRSAVSGEWDSMDTSISLETPQHRTFGTKQSPVQAQIRTGNPSSPVLKSGLVRVML